MYNENLAFSVLEVLNEQFPDVLHFKDLRGRLPQFSHVSEQEWLKTLDTLLQLGLFDGVPLPDGPGIADLANISITTKGRSVLKDERPSSAPNHSDDRRFAQLALDEARKSVAEDGQPRPRVGAVVVKDGKVLAVAHRGEFPGCHAEYIALEKKLKDVSLSGATVYTTLEPCTHRNPPKVPCAVRLAERKVARVVIGTLDPDVRIRGEGQISLREAGIVTDFFPSDLMAQIEELNRDFIRDRRASAKASQQPRKSPATIHFVPDRHNYGWAGNDGRTDVRAGGTFTYDGDDNLRIADVFVKGLTSRETLIQHLDGPGWLITTGLIFKPHDPLRLLFNLINDPITAERGKPMRFQLVFRDVYNQMHELDPVEFPWNGVPVSATPTVVLNATWPSLADKFKAIDGKPIQVWASWIYTIERKEWQWWIRHSSDVLVKMCIELCKQGGKMLLREPEFCRRFPDLAAITDDGDRWLIALHKVAGIGTGHLTGTSIEHGAETHSEGGEIRDLPGASQVLCQMAVNGFSD